MSSLWKDFNSTSNIIVTYPEIHINLILFTFDDKFFAVSFDILLCNVIMSKS